MALQWKEILRSDGDLKGKVDGEDVGDIKSGSQAGTAAKGVTDAAFDNNVLKEGNAHANLKNSAITLTSSDGTITLNNAGTGSFDKGDIGLTNVEDVALSSAGWADIGIATTDVSSSDVGLGSVLNQAQTSTFRQDACPTALAAGDMWFDTNDNNKQYRATAAGDDEVATGKWVEVSIQKSALGLVKGDVGLGNVDNSSAATIQAGTTKANVGLGNVDNLSEATIQTNMTSTHVGLGNVDNTSDATQQAATLAAADADDVGLGDVVNQKIAVVSGKIQFDDVDQALDADKIGGSTLAETKADAVSTATTNIIGDAPDALNTLNELAAALGDDASYASTVTTALGARQMSHVAMTSATAPAATGYSAGRTGTFGGTLYMVVDE